MEEHRRCLKGGIVIRSGGSKAKGNSHEWVVARALGKWFYDDSESLIRMPTSGALATMLPTNREHLVGDVLQVKGRTQFPFAVEAKHHKELHLVHLLFERKTSKLYKFWKLIKKESKKANKIPMLVFKSNFQDVLVVLPRLDVIDNNISKVDNYILTKTFIVIKFKDLIENEQWLKILSQLAPEPEYGVKEDGIDILLRRANEIPQHTF